MSTSKVDVVSPPLPEAVREQIAREVADLDIHDQNCDHMAECGGGVYLPCDCQRRTSRDTVKAMERIAEAATQQERARLAELLAELRNIADAKPSTWHEETRDQFQKWAQNRARADLAKVASHPPPTPEDR